MSIKTYECIELNVFDNCKTWQDVDDTVILNESEQSSILLAVLGVLVLVWTFKIIRKLI